ncbi:MAG: hypothetical protein ACD_8C00136G0005 [uncultured bacterium]|nr:MAG: hypothetical protein ACD_8C00136G0005 [uncultured bacterium]
MKFDPLSPFFFKNLSALVMIVVALGFLLKKFKEKNSK